MLIKNWIQQTQIRRLFCSQLTLRKHHIVRLCGLVIPLLTKTMIIYLKMISLYFILFYSLRIRFIRNVQNFVDVLWRVLILWRHAESTNFLEPVVSYSIYIQSHKYRYVFLFTYSMMSRKSSWFTSLSIIKSLKLPLHGNTSYIQLVLSL